MLVLYLRIKGGRIWYEPGFADAEDEFKKWRSITGSVRQGTFVPIVGLDVGERICGTTRELAERLAHMHDFPLAPQQRPDLAMVTQYLSVRESRRFAHDEVLKGLGTQILERHADLEFDSADLKSLYKAVIRRRY